MIDYEKKLEEFLDEEMGRAFAEQYGLSKNQIEQARQYKNEHAVSFTTAILDIHLIDKMIKEV